MCAAAATKEAGQAPAKAAGGLQVPRPAGHCLCGRPIAPDEKFMAAVREAAGAAGGLERIDVGAECWDGFDKTGMLAYWQTVMPRPEEKKKLLVDDEVLCTLFERLADATEPVKIQFR